MSRVWSFHRIYSLFISLEQDQGKVVTAHADVQDGETKKFKNGAPYTGWMRYIDVWSTIADDVDSPSKWTFFVTIF